MVGFYDSLYSLGDWPFILEKNLLKEGVSAKWRRSPICAILKFDVRSRKEASTISIWLI